MASTDEYSFDSRGESDDEERSRPKRAVGAGATRLRGRPAKDRLAAGGGARGPASAQKWRAAAAAPERWGRARLLALALALLWQIHTVGKLGAYYVHLRDAREHHELLQRQLIEADEVIEALRNSTASCALVERRYQAQLDAAARERRDAQYRLESAEELVAILNQTVAARDASVHAEQAKRLSLEGSVQGLREQMNLMQGQLVTAQAQQGQLHSKGHHGEHHGGGPGGGQWGHH
jgi:hypothetical protein